MPFVGAALLPHGAMCFDGDVNTDVQECRDRYAAMPPRMQQDVKALYEGCCQAASRLVSSGIELVVLHSPHGLILKDSLVVYKGTPATGTAEWNDAWKEFKVELPTDISCSTDLISHLKSKSVPAEELLTFAGLSAPLRWGEVVPLWYLAQALADQEIKLVIMTSPRSTPMSDYYTTAMKTGSHLAEFLDSRPERGALLISGDLSHVHGCPDAEHLPIYMPDPRSNFVMNSDLAAELDAIMESWVNSWNATPPDTAAQQDILKTAADRDPQAKVCGMGGICVMQGALESVTSRKSCPIGATVTVRRAPSYYGMMAAVFQW